MTTYQVTEAGAEILKKKGYEDGSTLNQAVLKLLRDKGYLTTGGSGPGEMEPVDPVKPSSTATHKINPKHPAAPVRIPPPIVWMPKPTVAPPPVKAIPKPPPISSGIPEDKWPILPPVVAIPKPTVVLPPMWGMLQKDMESDETKIQYYGECSETDRAIPSLPAIPIPDAKVKSNRRLSPEQRATAKRSLAVAVAILIVLPALLIVIGFLSLILIPKDAPIEAKIGLGTSVIAAALGAAVLTYRSEND